MTMALRVRNFLGIKKADLDLKGIVLVAGRNAGGKSSLIEAAAAAVIGSPQARGIRNKKDAAALLHDGADAGSIVLNYGSGLVRITYPEATVERSGKPEELGTGLGIGSAKFRALTVPERTREITTRFRTEPQEQDVTEWFRDRPDSAISGEAASALWAELHEQGWDATASKAREHGTRLKGHWEAATGGRRWGERIASVWCPTNLLPGETYDVEKVKAQLAEARERLEELIRFGAISARDRAQLEQRAATVDEHRAEFERLQEQEAGLSGEIELLLKQQNAKDAPVDTSMLPACPHCGKKVRIVRTGVQQYVSLEKPPAKTLTEAEIREARMQIANLDGRLDHTKTALTANATARTLARKALAEAEVARSRLAQLQAQPTVSDDQLAAARTTVLEIERKIDSIQALDKAKRLFAEWQQHQHIIEAVEPDGIRKTVLERRLSEINTRIEALCHTAKFDPVVIGTDLEVSYGGRSYPLLSESERWRCDLVIAALFGKEEGAKVILADRLDVIHPQARPGVLFLLQSLGIPALVGMTAKDPESVPDLARAKLGVVRWIDGGVLSA